MEKEIEAELKRAREAEKRQRDENAKKQRTTGAIDGDDNAATLGRGESRQRPGHGSAGEPDGSSARRGNADKKGKVMGKAKKAKDDVVQRE